MARIIQSQNFDETHLFADNSEFDIETRGWKGPKMDSLLVGNMMRRCDGGERMQPMLNREETAAAVAGDCGLVLSIFGLVS